MQHFFHVSLLSCCFILHSFHVALFSCCTFQVAPFPVLHFFHVAPFFVLHFSDGTLFSCCTFFFHLNLCCTFSCSTHFKLHFFRGALFSSYTVFILHLFACCTLYILHLFMCCTFLVVHFFHVAIFFLPSFLCCFMLHWFHVRLFSCCTFPVLGSSYVAPLFKLHYFHIATFFVLRCSPFLCFIFFVLFHVALCSCTFSLLHFNVSPLSSCTIFVFHLFHHAGFLSWTFFGPPSFVLYSFHVASFFFCISSTVAHFPCCTCFSLDFHFWLVSCFTLFTSPFFAAAFPQTTLFSCWTLQSSTHFIS